MSNIELYYDLSCPWSYLALVRLQDVADRNATGIDLKPVLVEQVLATENPPKCASRLAANPAKAAWQKQDLTDWASLWGLQLTLPESWPTDATLAATAATVAQAMGAGLEYSLLVFRAYFGSGQTAVLSDADRLADLAVEAGLDRGEFLLKLRDTDALSQVNDWTIELIRKGGFGTPTMFVGPQLFFGNDRMPLVDWKIGPMSDLDFVVPGQHG
jgi:2-hydroxychromene-2-carboxylate isomerase